MSYLFALTFLLSIACLVAGLVRPSIFARIAKRVPTRKSVALIFTILIIASFIGIGLAAPVPQKTKDIEPPKPVVQTPPADTVPVYESAPVLDGTKE